MYDRDKETPTLQPEQETDKGKERNSRENILNSFNSSFALLENSREEDLSPEDLWLRNALREVKAKTVDRDKGTFANTFEGHHTKETFTQEEGIPIEGLLDFLRRRLDALSQDDPQKIKIIKWGHTMYRNSQAYFRIPHRMEPHRYEARLHQEAHLISQDQRATGSADEDWKKAIETLSIRHELIIPPQEMPELTEGFFDPPILPSIEPPEGLSVDKKGEKSEYGELEYGETEHNDGKYGEYQEENIKQAGGYGEYSEYGEYQEESVEEIRRTFNIVNRTVDVRKRAAEIAEIQLREKLREGSNFNPLAWARKAKFRVMEEYYRQLYMERATKAMLENNNTFLTMDLSKNAVIDANNQIDKERGAGQAKIEHLKTGSLIEGERVLQAEGELKTALLNEIIRPVAEGTINDQKGVQEKLREFIENHKDDQGIKELFGNDATKYGVLADYFATDLLETGILVRQDIAANKYALEMLDKHIDINLANTDWAAEGQARFNMADKLVARIQKSRLGAVINPATVGAATSLVFYGGTRALGVGGRATEFAIPMAGLLPSAAFAGLRRNYDLKVDRASHQVEMAYGGSIAEKSRQRERLQKFAYDIASVSALLEGGVERSTLDSDTRGLKELANLDISSESPNATQNREAIVRRIAEIDSRLNFSSQENIDLITFGARETVEQDRLSLDLSIVEANVKLKGVGMTDKEVKDMRERFVGEWNSRFIQNQEQQDKLFRNYRLKHSAGAAVFGGVAGLAAGIGLREAVEGLRGVAGVDLSLGGIAHEAGKARKLKELFSRGGQEKVGNLNVLVDQNHEVSIVNPDTGKTLVDKGWSLQENGKIGVAGDFPSEIRQEFEAQGFTVEQGPDAIKTILDTNTESVTSRVPGHETTIPGGTKWIRDGSSPDKWDLVAKDTPDKILINDAQFAEDGKLRTFDASNSILSEENISETSTKSIKETIESKPVLGQEGEWTKNTTEIDRREWYSYNKEGSQGNELRLETFKDGDSVILDMSKMGQGFQQGLSPNPIDVQEAIRNHEAGFAFTLPDGGTLWIEDGADGQWDGLLRLDPNDVSHKVKTPNGEVSLSEFSKMVINQQSLSKLEDGNIATELYGHRDVFSVGRNGEEGFIEAGRLVNRDGQNVLQTFATIKGSSPIPSTISTPTEIATENFTQNFTLDNPITESVNTFEISPPEIEGPAPVIPTPSVPRWTLEELAKNEAVPPTEPPIEPPTVPPPIIDAENTERSEEEFEPEEHAETLSKGDVEHPIYTPLNTNGERDQVEQEKTSDGLIQERINDQQNYIDLLKEKYDPNSQDEDVQRTLFRLNGGNKSYFDELTELNSSLPPMSEETRLTVVIPAYNEEGKIERSITSWLNQKNPDGSPIDPKTLDILILVNRPNQTKEFDTTSDVIARLKTNPEYANLTINSVQKTFNFPLQDTTITGPEGEQINVLGGVMMGLVYKLGADLAVLRNLQRQTGLRKANHLMRTGGADVYARNPGFTSRVFNWFSENPDLEQYVSRADYPPAIYKKIPLLHFAQRLNEMMNVQFTNKGSNIGLGTYRMGIYSASGGFDSKVAIREEIELSKRIRKSIYDKEGKRKRDTIINALDDPRRAIVATFKGLPITQIYGNWGDESVRKLDLDKVLQADVPPTAALTVENVQKQANAVFNFYFRQILNSPASTNLTQEEKSKRAYELAEKYMRRSLMTLGVDHYELGQGEKTSADTLFVKISNIDKLRQLVEAYPGRERPAWIDQDAKKEESRLNIDH